MDSHIKESISLMKKIELLVIEVDSLPKEVNSNEERAYLNELKARLSPKQGHLHNPMQKNEEFSQRIDELQQRKTEFFANNPYVNRPVRQKVLFTILVIITVSPRNTFCLIRYRPYHTPNRITDHIIRFRTSQAKIVLPKLYCNRQSHCK